MTESKSSKSYSIPETNFHIWWGGKKNDLNHKKRQCAFPKIEQNQSQYLLTLNSPPSKQYVWHACMCVVVTNTNTPSFHVCFPKQRLPTLILLMYSVHSFIMYMRPVYNNSTYPVQYPSAIYSPTPKHSKSAWLRNANRKPLRVLRHAQEMPREWRH